MPGISSAPQIVQPSVPGEIASAIGDFPKQQQDYQLKQAEIDAQGIDNSSKKLAVLTKLISANPGLATNPQLIQSAQRSFQGLGMSAPLKNVNGVQSLDTDALYAFGPASEFIAQNLPMLLAFKPARRADIVQTATNQALPDGVAQRLASLPQKVIQSPQQLTSLFEHGMTMVQGLRLPGSDVGNVVATLRGINETLADNGMAGINTEEIEQSAYVGLLGQAQLQHLQGQAAEEFAQAGLAKIKTELEPAELAVHQENAAAHTVEAGASASRAASYAARTPAAIAHDYAAADQAEANTKKLVQEVATGGASLKDLEANANNARALVARLESDLNDPTQGLQSQITSYKAAHPEATAQNDPQLKQLNDDAYDIEQKIKGARKAADTAQSAFQQGQAHLHSGSPTSGQPAAQPQHLTATSGGKPIHSDDGGKTWQPGP
jgi:hypothetical protein